MHRFSFEYFLGVYLRVELPCHILVLWLLFEELPEYFSNSYTILPAYQIGQNAQPQIGQNAQPQFCENRICSTLFCTSNGAAVSKDGVCEQVSSSPQLSPARIEQLFH